MLSRNWREAAGNLKLLLVKINQKWPKWKQLHSCKLSKALSAQSNILNPSSSARISVRFFIWPVIWRVCFERNAVEWPWWLRVHSRNKRRNHPELCLRIIRLFKIDIKRGWRACWGVGNYIVCVAVWKKRGGSWSINVAVISIQCREALQKWLFPTRPFAWPRHICKTSRSITLAGSQCMACLLKSLCLNWRRNAAKASTFSLDVW